MKIVILSAGKGERLGPITRNTPKPLLDFGDGQTLVEKQFEQISKSGVVDEIILVIGYLADQIEAKIKGYKKEKCEICTLFNPFYDMSNNLISLWLAKHYMVDDFIIQNGDNLFTSDVYADLVQKNGEGIFVTTNVKDTYSPDDMKVTIRGGRIERVSKEIVEKNVNAESVGLVLVSGEKYRNIFQSYLEILIRNKEYLDKFWLEVFNIMSDKGVEVKPFEIDAKGKWQEIDIHLDFQEAKRLMGLES